ncbi:MAG TPA: hypothetical protein VFO38_04815 [Candidatus Saccharimonadales bacterium]|nr:hypothetical protein [Candidatus Saccharimonadales bacterium]
MTYLPPVNGGRINATISGNTAGAGALVSSGTLTLAGGNNITLSQNGNAITISGGAGGAAGSNTLGMSNLGNTIGTSGVVSGSALQFAFAGGNNVTLSQSLNASSGTITISAANQTVQTQNLHNVTLSGNTAGVMAQVSSGTLTLAGGNNITLSQNGNAVTISGGAGGGGIALANSQTTYTSGTANLNVAGGAMTIASTTGQSFNFSVPQTSSLSVTGGLSIATNGSTISIGAPSDVTYSYFNPQDAYIQVTGQQGQASLHFQPTKIPNVSFDRIVMPMVFTGSSNSTASVSVSMSIGIFTRDDSTLSLLTSFSASGAITHSGNVNSSLNNGLKLFTLGATSSLAEGQYYIGIISRTTTAGGNASVSQILASQQNSNLAGFWGQAGVASIQYTRGLGVYATTTTAMPSSVAFSQINGTGSIVLRQPIFYFVSGTV